MLGVVSLRDLVFARAGQPIAAVMNPDVISVPPEMDQEDVARLFEHYNMLALPVVDATHKILGIVTVDDVVSSSSRSRPRTSRSWAPSRPSRSRTSRPSRGRS